MKLGSSRCGGGVGPDTQGKIRAMSLWSMEFLTETYIEENEYKWTDHRVSFINPQNPRHDLQPG